MSRERDIENAFRGWVSDETGLMVIFDNQNGPRPQRPYITIGDVTGWVKDQQVDEMQEVDGDLFRIVGRRRKTFQVDCYGDIAGETNPLEVLGRLRDGLDDPLVVQRQCMDEYSVIQPNDIRDLSALRETSFEPRASMEFVLAAEFTRDTRTGYIKNVQVNGEEIGPL